EASSQPAPLPPLALPVLLMNRLLGDAEQGRDLLPTPAELARTLDLQLLYRLQERAQRRHAAEPDLRILARRLRHDLTRLDHSRQYNLTSDRRQDFLTAVGELAPGVLRRGRFATRRPARFGIRPARSPTEPTARGGSQDLG